MVVNRHLIPEASSQMIVKQTFLSETCASVCSFNVQCRSCWCKSFHLFSWNTTTWSPLNCMASGIDRPRPHAFFMGIMWQIQTGTKLLCFQFAASPAFSFTDFMEVLTLLCGHVARVQIYWQMVRLIMIKISNFKGLITTWTNCKLFTCLTDQERKHRSGLVAGSF